MSIPWDMVIISVSIAWGLFVGQQDIKLGNYDSLTEIYVHFY